MCISLLYFEVWPKPVHRRCKQLFWEESRNVVEGKGSPQTQNLQAECREWASRSYFWGEVVHKNSLERVGNCSLLTCSIRLGIFWVKVLVKICTRNTYVLYQEITPFEVTSKEIWRPSKCHFYLWETNGARSGKALVHHRCKNERRGEIISHSLLVCEQLCLSTLEEQRRARSGQE